MESKNMALLFGIVEVSVFVKITLLRFRKYYLHILYKMEPEASAEGVVAYDGKKEVSIVVSR
jgi:hypothetical protein